MKSEEDKKTEKLTVGESDHSAEPTVTNILEKRSIETLSAGVQIEYLCVWNGKVNSKMWVSRRLLLNEEAINLDTRKLKISEILATYSFDQYNNTTIQ